MSGLRKLYLGFLVFILMSLSLPAEVRADPVQLTLTGTTVFDASNPFTITGFFTNLGTATFQANRWDLTFTPNLGPHGQSAVNLPNGFCCTYAQPVPGMSSTPDMPLLSIALHGSHPPFGAGAYIGTLTFSGFDSNGLAITTNAVQIVVNVPVPEPATLLLLGTGLSALGASLRKRRRRL